MVDSSTFTSFEIRDTLSTVIIVLHEFYADVQPWLIRFDYIPVKNVRYKRIGTYRNRYAQRPYANRLATERPICFYAVFVPVSIRIYSFLSDIYNIFTY